MVTSLTLGLCIKSGEPLWLIVKHSSSNGGGGSEGKKSHRERYAEKNQGFCLPCQGHVLNHMKNVPWHVGMVADQRPFSWHVALADPFSNCPSGQWKVQADP